MEYEKEYIDYLIENKDVKNVDYLLENYLKDNIDLEDIEYKIIEMNIDVQSYRNFLKSKEIDDILNND